MKKYTVLLFVAFSFMAFSQTESELEDFDFFLSKGGSFLYSQRDSAYFYLNKSYRIAEETNFFDGKLNVLPYLIKANTYHFDLKPLKSNIDKFEQLIGNNSRLDTIAYGTIYKRRFLLEKGSYFYNIKNYPEAIKWMMLLKQDLESVPKAEITPAELYELNSAYSFLASIYQTQGKLELAKQYHTITLAITQEHSEMDWSQQIFNTRMRYASIFEKERDFDQANEMLQESLSYYISQKKGSRFRNNILSTYHRLTKNYLLQGSVAKALKTLKLGEQYYGKDDPFKREALLLYGDVYTAQENYTKAEVYYKEYLKLTKEYRLNQKHSDVAQAYVKIGKLYLTEVGAERALESYQNALIQLSVDFNSSDFSDNPKENKVSSKLELVKVLREKLKAFQLLYKNTQDVSVLKMALKTSYDMDVALDLLKPEFESKVDKQFLISEMYPAFHSMVSIAYDLYENTHHKRYVADAFHFMEKSKSILLLDAARSTQASSFGNIPNTLIEKEYQFRATIINLEKKLFHQKSNTIVVDSLFSVKNDYYRFISDIEQKYPVYHDLKYNTDVIHLKEVKSILGKEKALISYFAADEYLFVVTVEGDSSNFYKISFESDVKKTIQSFYRKLSKLNIDELSSIYKEGNLLYKQILEEPLQGIVSKKLIIIPDDMLNYIPFEALSSVNLSAHYLINEYQISYSNSVTLLQEQLNKPKHTENKLVAYAPFFGDLENSKEERSEFGSLLYNKKEAIAVANYFDGVAVTGDKASLHSVRRNMSDHTIVHFATHAAANDDFPDYSYLAFSKGKNKEKELLYVKDLYGYTINTELITLSACQTGLGKLQKGEGMLSLARGFNYAGAKSLVTTLWKINDQTTSQLMEDFYKNLSKNISKDEALRIAKLKYIRTSDDELLTHPYFWSGFMISGDMSPFTDRESISLWWLLLVIPLVGVVYRVTKKKPVVL